MADTQDIPSITIGQDMQALSKKQEQAYDHPGHFWEFVFNQKLASFHWEIAEILLEGHTNPTGECNPALVLAPRDHAKSTCGEAFILWKIGHNPLELVQIVSSVQPLAKQRLRKVASCIKENEKYRSLFGNLFPDDSEYTWSTEAIEVIRDRSQAWETGQAERDPTCVALGITTSVEGGRSTLQVFDDIVSVENSQSELTRDSVRTKFWMSFDPMLLPNGQQILFGTRYHYADFYSELIPLFDTEKLYTALYPDSPEQDE
tara:strand:+ start:2681 stop:3460 length:780 start_codon:yes stop_codon:yes gene_type:complete